MVVLYTHLFECVKKPRYITAVLAILYSFTVIFFVFLYISLSTICIDRRVSIEEDLLLWKVALDKEDQKQRFDNNNHRVKVLLSIDRI